MRAEVVVLQLRSVDGGSDTRGHWTTEVRATGPCVEIAPPAGPETTVMVLWSEVGIRRAAGLPPSSERVCGKAA
jgi:hypothetical protein